MRETIGAESVRRAGEIEDPTNLYVIHPLSAALVPIFARLRVRPNTVSLIGMGCGLLAGVAYRFCSEPGCSLAGLLLMLGWHVMDGADGQLARLTQRFSKFGMVLDGICDYVTFTAVYVGLALAMSASLGPWVWGVVAVSGVCHAAQSAAYELQRQEYNFWAWGRPPPALPSFEPLRSGLPLRRRLAARLYRVYATAQYGLCGGTVTFHHRLAALFEARADREALRAAYRAHFAPLLRRWSLLGANYRTLGIFCAAVIKAPLLYFAFEIVGLSLVLIALTRAQHARDARFLDGLGRRGESSAAEMAGAMALLALESD